MANNLSPEKMAEYREAFTLFDTNGDGSITLEELSSVMRSLGLKHTDSEFAEMIREADENQNGKIEFNEFVDVMTRSNGIVDVEAEVREAFNVFDENGNGFISPDELRRVMTLLGEELSDDTIGEMIREADLNGDGQVDFDEFVAIINSTNLD
ncbi:calmodulin-A-like [Teleopsis dalmanni]|uniref:calmodulin-A-like n=1 Tax=Teleopsis dalmanni TaxID=139649 RepID=UPI0018CD6EA8|nr:calmodulin-A-like [Teleopsis dalmanni]XP_037953624.1 calmodulin-A-like [Teleopsis dalmanni]XP_037953625.1 calmodulin-A-like [Teleopsis dalmanni]XP_037953626.1 calmodulin-A-like [Teleopsis dalmanni]